MKLRVLGILLGQVLTTQFTGVACGSFVHLPRRGAAFVVPRKKVSDHDDPILEALNEGKG